jgi:NAD(P)-dependent dehydrogenase (short-subunit alcohol dehydrogenase family)
MHVVGGALTIDELDGIDGVTGVALDLVDPAGSARLVEAAVEQHGRIDVLVNNVGGVKLRLNGFLDVSDDDFEASLQLNFFKGLPQDKYGVRLSPRVGGPHTVFIATFAAPFDANALVDNERNATSYQIEAFGPPGCAGSFDGTLRRIRRGQRVTLRLGRSDIAVPHAGVRRWCPGSYIANVTYVGHQDEVLLGNFGFRVRAPHP